MNLENLPRFISRCVLLGALVGVAVGVFISMNNDDGIAWALVRTGVLGALFAIGTKFAVLFVTKLWLESKVEDFEKQFEDFKQQKKVAETKKKK
jgi:hypothetical protein